MNKVSKAAELLLCVVDALDGVPELVDKIDPPIEKLALDACERVFSAIVGHTDWHPDPEVDHEYWNEDAHIYPTLTVADCRLLKEALIRSGRYTLQNETL